MLTALFITVQYSKKNIALLIAFIRFFLRRTRKKNVRLRSLFRTLKKSANCFY